MAFYLPDCPLDREIRYIVIHCSASRVTTNFTINDLRHLHVDIFHWSDIGYNFYICKDGKIYNCRPMSMIGAHTKGYKTIGYYQKKKIITSQPRILSLCD